MLVLHAKKYYREENKCLFHAKKTLGFVVLSVSKIKRALEGESAGAERVNNGERAR